MNEGGSHLLKLARFCMTLAMSVSVREVRSAGYSCIRLKSDGDMMAGHMKRRKREELIRLSARSSRPRSAHRALHEANTSFSSRGNMLEVGWEGDGSGGEKGGGGSERQVRKLRAARYKLDVCEVGRARTSRLPWIPRAKVVFRVGETSQRSPASSVTLVVLNSCGLQQQVPFHHKCKSTIEIQLGSKIKSNV